MHTFIRIVLFALGLGHCCTTSAIGLQTLMSQSAHDYQSYYRTHPLVTTGLLLGISGVFAHTPLDQSIYRAWQTQHVHTANRLFQPFNTLGGAKILIPFYLLLSFTDAFYDTQTTRTLSLWGNHATRIILLGGPQQALFTHALGSQRPEQGSSHWHFFKGKRAVSGHAFYGSVPLLSIAQQSQTPWVRYTFFTLSTLPGIARLHHKKHYFSQVLAGWGLAYLTSIIIQQPSTPKISYDLTPENHSLLFSAHLKF